MLQAPFVLFGEAERGSFWTGYHCRSLEELIKHLGNPPPESLGLDYAIQALLYKRELLFFRVREEGYSREDYALGLHLLSGQRAIQDISAICMPGVGDERIVDAAISLCETFHSVFVTSESDFYDLLTSGPRLD